MSVLTDEAEQARLAREAEEAAAVDQARTELRTAAQNALKAVLVRPDGTALSLSAAGLAMVHDDLANGLAVASDGEVALAVRRNREGAWEVRVVEQDRDGGWTGYNGTGLAAPKVESLADLGDVLAGKR